MSKRIRLKYIFLAGRMKKTSVFDKVRFQIEGLRNQGIEAEGWFFNTLEGEESNGRYNESILKIGLPPYRGNHRYFTTYHKKQHYFDFIANYVDEHSDEFDFIFLRHAANGKAYERLLKRNASKTLLYIPSNRIREKYCERRYTAHSTVMSAAFSWWEHIRYYFREMRLIKRFLPRLRAVVTFTPEFGGILAKDAIGSINNIYNRDGTNTGSVPHRSCKKREGEVVKLIFLKGSQQEQKWAGLDRLIKSIESYPEIPIRLYITGNAINQKERYGRPFVTLTGRLPFNELEELIDDVDLGVSNLENYLIHFNETTNLKSRDYYSRGLPFIQSNTMPDIEGTEAADYYLHIPNDDSIIDMKKVYDFALEMRDQVDHPENMHEFATKHLDWKVTTAELAREIKSLV